jgi:hypothetical protein
MYDERLSRKRIDDARVSIGWLIVLRTLMHQDDSRGAGAGKIRRAAFIAHPAGVRFEI